MKQSIRIACTGADSVPLQSIFPFQGDLKSLSPINYEKLKQQILEHGSHLRFTSGTTGMLTKRGASTDIKGCGC